MWGFLKDHWQKILIVILIILLYWLFNSWQNSRSTIGDMKQLSKAENAKVTHWKDKYGREHAEVIARTGDLKTLQASENKEFLKLKSEVKKWKNLYTGTVFSTQTSGNLGVTLHDTTYLEGKDTTRIKIGSWEDAWLKAKLKYYPSKDSIHLDYNYADNFTVVHKYKRSKWYKRKDLVLSILPENKKTSVTEAYTYVVKPKKKPFWKTDAFLTTAAAALAYFIKK